MQGDTEEVSGWWYLSYVLKEFPGWTLEYAERAIIKEQERGWPIRNMLLLRRFEEKLWEIQQAEKSGSSVAPPQDRLAKRVYAARVAANESHLRDFQEQRDSPREILAKLGIKAE